MREQTKDETGIGGDFTAPLRRSVFNMRDLAEVARSKLTFEEVNALIQEDRDAVAPLVYSQGLRDGEAKLLERQRDERERRKVARGRKVWVTAVYFIRSPQAIKIGISKNPARRLSVLQTSHPDRLDLVATCEGGRELERDYHLRFAAHRHGKGEWFSPHPDILAEIERLNGKAP